MSGDVSRANGRRSRGPRTREGKARSCQNARKFGLSLPVERAEPGLTTRASEGARALLGGGDHDPQLLRALEAVLIASWDVQRVRRAMTDVLAGAREEARVAGLVADEV